MNSADREELDWLAFLYVAGDLAPDEHSDFEQRLAHDQTARDAVAEAVELAQAIRTAEATKSAPVYPVRRRRLWLSLRLAACLSACALVVVVCHQFLLRRESGRPDVREAPSTSAVELAVVWSEMRLELAEQQSDASALPLMTDPSDSLMSAERAVVTAVPDWMFAAVASEADRISRGEEDG